MKSQTRGSWVTHISTLDLIIQPSKSALVEELFKDF